MSAMSASSCALPSPPSLPALLLLELRRLPLRFGICVCVWLKLLMTLTMCVGCSIFRLCCCLILVELARDLDCHFPGAGRAHPSPLTHESRRAGAQHSRAGLDRGVSPFFLLRSTTKGAKKHTHSDPLLILTSHDGVADPCGQQRGHGRSTQR